jgi:hypothetical protein
LVIRDWKGGKPLSVFWAALFRPGQLGRQLPPKLEPSSVERYSWTHRLVAAGCIPGVVGLLLAIMSGEGAPLLVPLFSTAPIIIASMVSEECVTAILTRLVVPRAVPPAKRRVFWRNFSRLFVAHLVILVIVMPSLMMAMVIMNHHIPMVVLLTPLAIGIWWWCGISAAVRARSLSDATVTTVASLLIPLAGIVGIVCACLVCMFEGTLLDRML